LDGRRYAAAEARDAQNIHAGHASQGWSGMADLRHFAEWLSTTSQSVFIQDHYSWVIPTIQSIHIVGIGVLLGSVLMVDLRILGWAGTDQTLRQTTSRFAPWVTGALCLQLATGVLMVIAVRHHEQQWQETLVNRRSIKWLAVLTFLIWVCIIILGRLIAYDHVWGSWSPARRA
jgi:small-conductance mechanosensitive channel